MVSEGEEGQSTPVLQAVLGGLVFLIVLVAALVVSSKFYERAQGSLGPTATASAAAAPGLAASQPAAPVSAQGAANAARSAADEASVKVEQGVAKFYFASGKAELPAGAGDALAGVVGAAGAGRTLVITGFHDATGDATKNAELARQRALAVRTALKAAGVPERQIEIGQSEPLDGTDNNAEARRVEINLQ
ncbi:MAG: OmpA family protein [Polaromonas sp.]